MVALLDKSGAYLYDCPVEEFAQRVAVLANDSKLNVLDYTEKGAARREINIYNIINVEE